MTFAPNPPSKYPAPHVFHPRKRIYSLILIAILFLAIIAFRGAGRWLVRPDALEHADAIVILSGGLPFRAEEAAEVFRMGYAPQVWTTHPQSSAAALQSMGIQFYGEDDYDRQILIHLGVPADRVRTLPGTIMDTQQELTEAAHQLRQEGKSSVIIVTSPEHTRRVRTLWSVIADKKLVAIVCAAPQDPFDADHWWENTRDAFSVVREYMGLINAWLRLPVRPAAS